MAKRAIEADWGAVLSRFSQVGGPPSTPAPKKAKPRVASDLHNTIQDQIIPRLLLAHADGSLTAARSCPDTRLPPSDEEIESFAERAVEQDMTGLLSVVETMSRAGLSLESLLLDLVAPAARLLGDQWLNDERSFADVTIGLGALHRVTSVLGRGSEPPLAHRGLVLLTAAPGEQHTLGIQILGELLRQAGWGAQVEPGLDRQDLLGVLAAEMVAVLGISVSNAELFDSLGDLVADARRASRNEDLVILLGGGAEVKARARLLGVAYCADARDTLTWLGENPPSNGASEGPPS